jgi:glucose/arabinose dehydrogenase
MIKTSSWRRLLLIPVILFTNDLPVQSQAVTDSAAILFNIDTVAKNLGYPWEITQGPDDSLWITEARGYRVLRISADRTGTDKNRLPQQILKIPLGEGGDASTNFSRNQESIGRWPQGGMQGLVIHPDFFTGKPWVYLSYVFKVLNCPNSNNPCYYRSKIVRCRFYFSTETDNPSSLPKKDTLVIMDTVISNLPGSNDHNSGRLTISPLPEADGKYKLYYTIGDMGAGQFNNAARTNRAQNRDTCEGKILRLDTEPDLTDIISAGITHDYNTWRQWIPDDNPFNHSSAAFSSLKTPVFSYGHRNAQGIAWGNINGSWHLYSSEHGDKSDDEVNEIFQGKNYGWPRVAGMCEDNYTTADDGAPDFFTNNNTLAGQTITNEAASFCNVPANNNQRPMFSTFNWTPAQLEAIDNGNIFTWPTIAPSGIDFYSGSQLPGWRNSLLVTSLKYGMFRLKLNTAGTYIDSLVSTNAVDTFPLLHGWRVRDLAVDRFNGGAYIWVAIDSSGSTSGPTGGFSGSSSSTRDGGKILKLTYKNMTTLAIGDPPPGPPVVTDLIRIYPNPVHDLLYVHGKKNLRKPLLVQLYDMNGRLLKTEKSYKNDFAINVSSFRAGIYILKLYNGYDMEVQIEKFLKE